MEDNTYKKVPLTDIGENDPVPSIQKYGWGIRHIQTFLLFLSFCVAYIARSHLGVTIVAMTIIPNVTVDKLDYVANVTERENFTLGSQNNDLDFINNDTINYIHDEMDSGIYRIYSWSKPIQETIHSAFFFGYSVAQLLMGMVAQRWGGKICLQIALLINGITSFATPWLVLWGGWKALTACRVAQGLSQAGILPSLQLLIAEWFPNNERGTLSSYIYAGPTLGTVLAFQFAGVFLGWPSVFWGAGIICGLTYLSLTLFGSDTPYAHKSISEEERVYITQTMDSEPKQKPKIPWKAIWTSKHVWAIFTTHCGSGVAFMFLLMQVPTYVHYTLGVDVKNSGILSSLPFIASMFTSILFGMLSDFFTNRNILSIKNGRRLFNSVSQIGAAICLIAFTFTKNIEVAIFLLVTALACFTGIQVGWMMNCIDLTPNFGGTITAIGNTIMNGVYLIVPVLVSFIITDVTDQYQWRIMFIFAAGCAFISNAIFVIFMSAEKQPWNDLEYEKSEIKTEKSKDKK